VLSALTRAIVRVALCFLALQSATGLHRKFYFQGADPSLDGHEDMLQVDIRNDYVRVGRRLEVSFQRTLRIPDDGRTYPLPPGLGRFPLLCVEDFRDRLPPL
jgi:hypothetical protein